jgi:hypothetical protein
VGVERADMHGGGGLAASRDRRDTPSMAASDMGRVA